MAEPIEMLFGMLMQVGSRNCVLDGGTDPPQRKGHFFWGGGKWCYRDTIVLKKVKASHTHYQALGPELIPVYRQSARR